MVTDTCNGFRGAVVGSTGRHAWVGLTFGAMKGEKTSKSTNSKIHVIRDMFLTPNANAYERSMLLTPNINVYERRLLHRATQYVSLWICQKGKVDRWLVRRLRRGDGW